jgi:hypothetical protein
VYFAIVTYKRIADCRLMIVDCNLARWKSAIGNIGNRQSEMILPSR